jgi:high-affinity nickel permease
MQSETSFIFLFFLAITLGLRHGIDWDHIAALADIIGSTDNKKSGLKLGTLYILGHATVIIILGLLCVLIGVTLPSWVDAFMGRVVGTTLILLGIWLLSSILLHGKQFKMKSSRIFLIEQSLKIYNWIHNHLPHTHTHQHVDLKLNVDKKTSYIVGVIHGIGAETPTQMLLFVTAAGVGKGFIGTLLVCTFVLGLVTSNFLITFFTIFGFSHVNKNPYLRLGLGTLSGVFSLIVGTLLFMNKAGMLPAILGG